MRSFLAVLCCVLAGAAVLADLPPASRPSSAWSKSWDSPWDCRFARKGDRLTITVPGKGHDLDVSKNRLHAPCDLRDVEGDFAVQVRVGEVVYPPVGKGGFRRAGLIMTDGKTFIKVQRIATNEVARHKESTLLYRPLWNELSAVDSVRLLFFAGNPPIEELGLPGDPLPDKPIYFRLERRGAKVRVAFSKDGSNWDPMEPPFHALDDLKLRRKVRVGVVVESTATGAFEVSFDQFKLTRLKDEEKKKKTRN